MFYINLEWLKPARLRLLRNGVGARVSAYDPLVQGSQRRAWVNEGLSEFAQEVALTMTRTPSSRRLCPQPGHPTQHLGPGPGQQRRALRRVLSVYGLFLAALRVSDANSSPTRRTAYAVSMPSSKPQACVKMAAAPLRRPLCRLGSRQLHRRPQRSAPTGSTATAFSQDAPVVDASYSVYPAEPPTTVNNYAADYALLKGRGDVTVHFEGQTATRLANLPPPTGPMPGGATAG